MADVSHGQMDVGSFVYDNDGVVYHDELITDKSYASKINLDQLSSGNYTIEVSSGGKSTSKTVTIQ